MQNLLLSQLKAADKIMQEMKQKVYDYEYLLENHKCTSKDTEEVEKMKRLLQEMVNDFDTLITYCAANLPMNVELNIELIRAAEASKRKVQFLIEKLC